MPFGPSNQIMKALASPFATLALAKRAPFHHDQSDMLKVSKASVRDVAQARCTTLPKKKLWFLLGLRLLTQQSLKMLDGLLQMGRLRHKAS